MSAEIEDRLGYCVATVRLPDGAIWKTGFGYIQMQNVKCPEQEFEFFNVYFEMDNALPAEKLVNIGEHRLCFLGLSTVLKLLKSLFTHRMTRAPRQPSDAYFDQVRIYLISRLLL